MTGHVQTSRALPDASPYDVLLADWAGGVNAEKKSGLPQRLWKSGSFQALFALAIYEHYSTLAFCASHSLVRSCSSTKLRYNPFFATSSLCDPFSHTTPLSMT